MSLFLLGRKLMLMAESALPVSKTAKSGRLVFVDVAYHPDSSITEITERTGFPQSLVSTAVARLREIGLLEMEIAGVGAGEGMLERFRAASSWVAISASFH